jgi:PAS domain S-box-containing protein
MKIKTYLIFGVVFLFAEFFIISLSSLYFIYKISQQNNLITKDNNLSIGYAENMLQSIDKINDIKASLIFNPHYLLNESEFSGYIKEFEKNLISEEKNITETGEMELAKSLRNNFEKLKIMLLDTMENSKMDKSSYYYTNLLPTINEIKFALFAVSDVNMNSIVRKNITANNTANHSYLVLSMIATICFLTFFIFIFIFPKYIAEPIEMLIKSIKEISNKNYGFRVHFNAGDEFGKISKEFNEIANRLEEFEKINIEQLLKRKKLTESIINGMDKAILVLDEHLNIALVNILAEKLLGLSNLNIINKNVYDIASNNDLLRFMIREINLEKGKEAETYTLTLEGIKTTYASEMHIITTYDQNKDLFILLGYEISLKKISKTFD